MKPQKKFLLSLLALALATVLISQFYKDNTMVTLLLLLGCVVILIKSWHQKADLIPFVVAAVIGPTVEAVIIHYGAWTYANPTAFGIPMWLPLLWGFTGYFVTKMSSWAREMTRW